MKADSKLAERNRRDALSPSSMSAILEQMIAEAEIKLTALRALRDRLSQNGASPFNQEIRAQNEALMSEWELKLGELNRSLMRAKIMDVPDLRIP